MEEQPINPHAAEDEPVAERIAHEETVWKGTPSQITNLGIYILCLLFCWLIVPIFYALYRYLKIRTREYEVTTQRVRQRTGILSKETDDLELYRIKDMRLEQPFLLRMVGAGDIILMTSDRTSERLVLHAIRPSAGPRALLDEIRKHVEIRRDQKRVREVDLQPMDEGPHG